MRFFHARREIQYSIPGSDQDSLYFDYFRFESELPRPPVASMADYTLPLKHDSSFVFPLVDTAHYDLNMEGMYFVRVDNEQDEGLTLFNFGGHSPM